MTDYTARAAAMRWIDKSGDRALRYVIRRAVRRLRDLREAKAIALEQAARRAQRLDMLAKWSRAIKRYEEPRA